LHAFLPQGGSVLDIFKAITTEPLELPRDVLISGDLRHLLHRLFDKDPATRITVGGRSGAGPILRPIVLLRGSKPTPWRHCQRQTLEPSLPSSR
jgi:hypothetical protein